MREILSDLAWGALAWQAVSLVLNLLLTWKTPEQWEAWVAAHPRGAKVVYFLRAAGLNLPGLLRKLKARVDAKAGADPQPALPAAIEQALANPNVRHGLEAEAVRLLAEAATGRPAMLPPPPDAA